MNTPETINIEKYANALNNLIGVDSAYMAGDKDVDAIVELIVAAKKLENRIKELTKENERLRIALDAWEGEAEEAKAENVKLADERDRCLGALSELSDNIGLLKDKARADAVRKMQEELREYFSYNSIALYRESTLREIVDQITKEMLEDTE